jgi:hypothetical protein
MVPPEGHKRFCFGAGVARCAVTRLATYTAVITCPRPRLVELLSLQLHIAPVRVQPFTSVLT